MDFRAGIKDYISRLMEAIGKLDVEEINTAMNVILDTYQAEGNIYIFGNGGSASTASHYACDFNKGINEYVDKKFNFVCLNDNIPTMMAIANDIGYEDIFVYQLQNKLKANDLVIGISGSGNSPNIIKAIKYANQEKVKTLGITGYDGGKLREISAHSINTSVHDMQISEDIHMIIDHLMMQVMMGELVQNKS